MGSTAAAVTDEETLESLEMQELFDELKKCVKRRILDLAREKHGPAEMADALGLPEKAVLTLICIMVQEGSIRITEIGPTDRKEA